MMAIVHAPAAPKMIVVAIVTSAPISATAAMLAQLVPLKPVHAVLKLGNRAVLLDNCKKHQQNRSVIAKFKLAALRKKPKSNHRRQYNVFFHDFKIPF